MEEEEIQHVGAKVEFNSETMIFPHTIATPIWVKNPTAFGTDQLKKVCSYLGFLHKESLTAFLNTSWNKPLIETYARLSKTNFDIVAPDTDKKSSAKAWKPNQNIQKELFKVLADFVTKAWLKNFIRKELALVDDLDDLTQLLIAKFPLADEELPDSFDPALNSAPTTRYYLNLIALIYVFYHENQDHFKSLDFQVIYNIETIPSETWYRIWIIFKCCSAYKEARRASTWRAPPIQWESIHYQGQDTPSAPRSGMITETSLVEMSSYRLPYEASIFPLDTHWQMSKHVGFDPIKLSYASSDVILPGYNTRPPLSAMEVTALLNYCIRNTNVIAIGSSERPSKVPDFDLMDKVDVNAMVSTIKARESANVIEDNGVMGDTDKEGAYITADRKGTSPRNLVVNAVAEDDDENQGQRLLKGLLSETATAPEPHYSRACKAVGITKPSVPKIEQVVLKPWQVTGAAFMVLHEDGCLPFRILADDCGLGKTITALLTIYTGALRDERNGNEFAPSLVLVPASVLHNWIAEAREKFPSFRIIALYSKPIDNILTCTDMSSLLKVLRKLDSKDSRTSRTMVLCTYETWRIHSILVDEQKRKRRHEKERIPMQKRNSNYARSDATSLVDFHFERIILDEATFAKNPSSRTSISIQHTSSHSLLFLSATSFDNSISDIFGIVALMKNYLPQPPGDTKTKYELADFEDFCSKWDSEVGISFTRSRLVNDETYDFLMNKYPTEEGRQRYAGFYDPDGTTACTRYGLQLFDEDVIREVFFQARRNSPKGVLPSLVAKAVLRALVRPILLKRSKRSQLNIGTADNPVWVSPGEDIPSSTWQTIDLDLDPEEKLMYDRHFAILHSHRTKHSLENRKGQGKKKDESDASIDFSINRLCTLAATSFNLACLSRRLDFIRLCRRTKAAKSFPPIDVMQGKHDDILAPSDRYPVPHESARFRDHNTSFFLKLFSSTHTYQPPFSRADAVRELVEYAPKLRFAVRRMLDQPDERLVIFTCFPLTQLLLESIAVTLEIPTISLRAMDSANLRAAKCAEFCKPTSQAKLFITTTIGNMGINLHTSCHRVLIIDLPANVNALVQMGGRIERVGQTQHPVIEILTLNHTFDVPKQGSLAKKYVSLLAGQASFDLEDTCDVSQETAISYICEEVLRRMLGQSCSRWSWVENKDTVGRYSKILTDGTSDPIHDAAELALDKGVRKYEHKRSEAEDGHRDAGLGLKMDLITSIAEKGKESRRRKKVEQDGDNESGDEQSERDIDADDEGEEQEEQEEEEEEEEEDGNIDDANQFSPNDTYKPKSKSVGAVVGDDENHQDVVMASEPEDNGSDINMSDANDDDHAEGYQDFEEELVSRYGSGQIIGNTTTAVSSPSSNIQKDNSLDSSDADEMSE